MTATATAPALTLLRSVPIHDIRPSPENDDLYRPVDLNDPDIVALANSIGQHGVQEPLILTSDHYVISGHRRLAAASWIGLDCLPCRIRPDVSRQDDPDLFMQLLRECNRQRVKTADEKLREEVVTVNADEAYANLVSYRLDRAKSAMADFCAIAPGAARDRKAISRAKAGFLAAIQEVVEDRRDFWPLSDRQIHYSLLNDPPLIHASKPGSRYRNDHRSYKALVDLLTRGRLAGLIDSGAIADETRPVTVWDLHRDVHTFMQQELDNMMRGYARDVLQSQPNHIELVVEKNTLAGILRPVAMRYGLPFTSGRGYLSLPPRAAMADRFRASGKTKFVLLVVSDFDPDGETIAQSLARSLRDDFNVHPLEAVKVALTAEQVLEYELPPQMTAKAGSATRRRFVEAFGEHVYEVEALDPAELQRITCKAVEAALDVEAFNAEVAAEKEDAAFLEAARRRVLEAMMRETE